MNRRLIFLTSLVVLLSCLSAANAGGVLKVDIALSGPVAYTYKGGEWIASDRWGTGRETHDAIYHESLGGTGITVGFGIGDGSGNPGTILDYTTDADEPICNTWIIAGEPDPQHEDENCHIVLSGPGLAPGDYSVYGYHNSLPTDVSSGTEPCMPRVYVQTYSGALYEDVMMQNVGAPNDTDGGGVIVEANDADVPINHVTDDASLEANRSFVKFYTDGSPVKITYEAAEGSKAVLNAFIIYYPTPKFAWSPFPEHEEGDVCPNTSLTWKAGEYANKHNLYLDPNLTEEKSIFKDDLEDGDANWVHPNWTIYDSNVLGDGNSDGNSASFSHSFTPGSGSGTLTSVAMDTNEANSMRVELHIKKTAGIETGDIDLYYYDGSSWDYVADLNSVGANDVWLHYTDDVNEDEYFITNFRLKLESDISAGELFIDDVSITNTWPILDEWFVETLDTNSYPLSNLDLDTTYYWRVDEVNDACSASPWQGFTWEFTTETGKARDPSPYDHAASRPLEGITLQWTPTCLATSGDYLYLSTDFNDVNDSNLAVRFGPLSPPHDTGELLYATKYYWKVNGIGAGALPEGDVWRFQTPGYPLMHYEFDGVLDANVHDPCDPNVLTDFYENVTFNVSGDGELRYDEPNPLWNTAGTSARFEPNEEGNNTYGGGHSALFRDCFGPDLLDLDGSEYTIEAWVRQDGRSNYADNEAFLPRDPNMEGTIIRKEILSYGLGIDDDGFVKFMHKGQTISSEVTGVRITRGEWYHIAAVYDDDAGGEKYEKLYINGAVVADNNVIAPNPQDDYGKDEVGIGAYRRQTESSSYVQNHFNGAIDELRVMDIALSPGEFLIRGDRGIAWLPRPYNGQSGVAFDVNLAWNPGDLASSHRVYFGTDWDDVNDMTEPCATPSIGNEEYNPGQLQPDTTFFWRVDEVNDSNLHVWTGQVWQFSTSDFVFLDDFEHYTQAGDTSIGGTWYFGPTMGSQVSLAKVPQYPVHGGVQGMRYKYWTDKLEGFPFVQQFDYAEAYLPLSDPMVNGFTNWSGFDLRLLAISFSGKPDNDTTEYEQMYLGVSDTGGLYAEMRYGDRADEDMNDLKVEEWQEWYVPFVWFTEDGNAAVANDIDFSSIENVYLGFGDRRDPEAAGKGEVFFDDLLVSMPTCVPEKLKPPYDFSNNCIVDITDVGIMAGDWLKHDVNFADHLGIQVQEPCDANLVGHWKLDEGEGAFAYDSSTYENHGIVETNDVNVFWVVGHDGNALEFVDGGRVRVDHTPELTPMHQVSVSVWIKYSDKQDNARVVTKGSADGNETYQLEVDGEDVLAFYIRDGNDYDPCGHVDYKVQSDIVIRRDEWTHVAGTFDGNSIKCYINGELVAESDDPNIPAIPYLCQDTNDLGIGNRPDANEVRFNKEKFKGTIDDVRIYDYGLSQAEVGWLASEGTGYVPLTSPYNIYSGEFQEAVNLKDFAELLNYWGDEQLWPPDPVP